MSIRQPLLPDVVERLKSLDSYLLEKSPKDVADVYVAAVAFMVKIKQDQATILDIQRNNTKPATYPPPDAIPAITCVLTDSRLFSAFLNCLRLGHPALSPSSAEVAPNGRKRSLSLTKGELSTQAKSFKSSHSSPVPSRKTSVLVDLKTQQKPSFQLPVLAAAILSVSFAHLDHWPTPLIDAYVSDCFGSRLWVDQEPCHILVKNLSFTHNRTTSDTTTEAPDSTFLENASLVASRYRNFKLCAASSDTIEDYKGATFEARSVQKMERTLSVETVDSGVRDQVPYERDWEMDYKDDQNEQNLLSISSPRKLSKKRKSRGDDSSSSGGEDEEDIALSGDDEGSEGSKRPRIRRKMSSRGTPVETKEEESHYPVQQKTLNLQLVRQRYFGDNLQASHEVIHRALLERLEQKSKQNSGLLQTLPHFMGVPSVRALVAEYLSRWLQSPALAGLARKLFSELVDNMQNVDPPLVEDIRAIDFILSMKLKANQFAAHMENVTAVASRIPSLGMAQHIYTTLLRDSISSGVEPPQSGIGDPLTMVCGVHKALPTAISYCALASSLLILLVGDSLDGKAEKIGREGLVYKLRRIIRTLSMSLGISFDAMRLMEAFLALEFDKESRGVANEEDKARLMFQCVTLHVSASSAGVLKSTRDMDETQRHDTTRKLLHKARKSLLSWCCSDYGPRWYSSRKRKLEKDDELASGAGVPNYRSTLGPDSGEESIPIWLNTMRCLLLIEEANSDLMSRFLSQSKKKCGQENAETENTEVGEHERIKTCCAYGADVDDDMVRIILRENGKYAGSLPSEMAVQLLEHLFESCGRSSGTSLRVSDPDLVWDLYKLAQYIPPDNLLARTQVKGLSFGEENDSLPRLALPGLWWRVTILGLVMCGASPDKIGNAVWRDHPTLHSLMKMITASRYRFPTVDCDETGKEQMKSWEHEFRERENIIAEALFLPDKQLKETKNGKSTGYRVSRRLLKRQEEKEAAAALAESLKRKKMLKFAQKSIMLWDPDGHARKPPREAVELLRSVEKLFNLSSAFQRCTTPDFILWTIGETSRGAIERAYDWLIPIISAIPELISRLPSSASCFLLLRAYGSDTGDGSQLKKLSAPLLSHVKESLRGEYGEKDCIHAFELLMSDAASHNADRRMSARRVLQDALGSLSGPSESSSSSSSWMRNVLLVSHAKSLIPSAIKHMSKAATYERGKVLKSLIFALRDHLSFAEDASIETSIPFPIFLARLMSQRPSVYAEAIDRFADLQELTVNVLHAEISRLASDSTQSEREGAHARIWLEFNGTKNDALVSLDLLQSCCILLSVWREKPTDNPNSLGVDIKKCSEAVKDMTGALLKPSSDMSGDVTWGLAGATNSATSEIAVSVESWIMLCKAPDDLIGKKAALAAPEEFLARLLMSSGLPQAAMMAMVDRLGKLGETTDDKDKLYRKLMLPSASSEWDLGRIGKQRDIIQKLLGRMSAYFRTWDLDESLSTSFLNWLEREARYEQKPKKSSKRKAAPFRGNYTASLRSISRSFDTIKGPILSEKKTGKNESEPVSEVSFFAARTEEEQENTMDLSLLITSQLKDKNCEILDGLILKRALSNETKGDVAISLLQAVQDVSLAPGWMADSLLKWVPFLCNDDCPSSLKEILFRTSENQAIPRHVFVGIIRKCILTWTMETTLDCLDWILSLEEKRVSEVSSPQTVFFLMSSLENRPTRLSEQESKIVGRIALNGVDSESFDSISASKRNHLPNPIRLLLKLAEGGKKHYLLVGDMILERIGRKPSQQVQDLYCAAFLRLYLLHPQWANTGAAKVRTVLLKSAESSEAFWHCWVSKMDDQLDDLLESLALGDVRVMKSLTEQSRKYPLLILRKSRAFVGILKADACASQPNVSTSPCKVRGNRISRPVEAVMDGRKIVLNIRYWGLEFCEPLWMGVLEIFGSIPKEVLYVSGQKLGLWNLLDCVLQLLLEQLHSTTSNSVSKIKSKVSDMMATYAQVNSPGYYQWLSSVIDGTTEVRNVLVSLSMMSPEDAIESLKKAGELMNM